MLDYIRSFLTLIFAISMMYMLLDCEIKFKKNRYLFWLYVMVVLICDGLVLFDFGYITFMELYPIIVQLPSFLAFAFLSKFNVIKVFFVHLTLVAITLSFSLIGIVISYFFDMNRAIPNIVCYIMYLPAALFFYRYLRPSFLYMLRNTDKGWVGFCTIPLSYTVLIYLISNYNMDKVKLEPRTIVFAALILILAFAAYALILQFFKQTREQLTLQNEQNLLQIQVTAAKMHLEELKESQEKTIIYRHDMRHHLNLIGVYLADNNKEAALGYISEVKGTIAEAVVERYCSNYTVNLILYFYITKAKNEGVSVETQIDLPVKTTVSDMDLCVIFANSIENATNACKRIQSEECRTIKIVCRTKNDKLFIQVTNSYEGTVIFDDDVPVRAEENNGLGTKSIVAVTRAYGGIYSFTAEDGIFTASIIL